MRVPKQTKEAARAAVQRSRSLRGPSREADELEAAIPRLDDPELPLDELRQIVELTRAVHPHRAVVERLLARETVRELTLAECTAKEIWARTGLSVTTVRQYRQDTGCSGLLHVSRHGRALKK